MGLKNPRFCLILFPAFDPIIYNSLLHLTSDVESNCMKLYKLINQRLHGRKFNRLSDAPVNEGACRDARGHDDMDTRRRFMNSGFLFE